MKVFNPQARDQGLRRSWGADPETPVIIHVSRLAAEKNYSLLLKSYKAILHACPNAKFVIVGGGPMESALKRDFPFAIFPGAIPLENRPALARLYASSDIFLYPSKTETYGNVATEAMACGNALVGFDYAAPGQHIKQGITGFKADLDDDESFVEHGLKLATNTQLRREIGLAASGYSEAFDWQPIVDRFESILFQVKAENEMALLP
nr:glycosyltransferase [Pelagicoccus albus]